MGEIQLRKNTMQNYVIVRFYEHIPREEITLTPQEMRQLLKLVKEAGF